MRAQNPIIGELLSLVSRTSCGRPCCIARGRRATRCFNLDAVGWDGCEDAPLPSRRDRRGVVGIQRSHSDGCERSQSESDDDDISRCASPQDSPTLTEVELLLLLLAAPALPLLPLLTSFGPGEGARRGPGDPIDETRGPPLNADMVLEGVSLEGDDRWRKGLRYNPGPELER